MQKLYYVDTSIWLNLFKKEGDPTKGVPYWKIADDFFKKAKISSDTKICISTIVLKELSYKLKIEFFLIHNRLKRKAVIFKVLNEDYLFARDIEKKHTYTLSFADCLHIAIAKRNDCVLVTRDRELLEIGNIYVLSKKPEDLIS